MNKNKIKSFSIFLLLFALLWCLYVTYQYPYLGIDLTQNSNEEWIVNDTVLDKASISLDIKVGDRIVSVNGQPAEEVAPILKWRVVEQARDIIISRDGVMKELHIEDSKSAKFELFQLFSGLFCLLMALVLYVKMRSSRSAQLLSLIFLSGGAIYVSLGASVRGDEIGKILISSFLLLLPIFLYHFLVDFLMEKGNIILPRNIIRYLYGVVILGAMVRVLYFIPPLTYTIHKYSGVITLFFFSIGFIVNLLILMYLYFKYRKKRTYFTTILRTVWFSLMLSFLPVIILSFLPEVIWGSSLVIPEYTSIFALLFPLSFAYLLATDQIYDVSMVLRRFAFALLLSFIPCAMFTVIFAMVFPNDVEFSHLLFLFLSSSLLVSIILYSMEYLTTRFEGFMFPKRYVLKIALKKISRNLETISSFRELKDIILVDIVETLEVWGAAIVFNHGDHVETITTGSIDNAEVEMLITVSPAHHSKYTCMQINRHEEFTSYLVLTRKKTNILLGREEVQWLNLITTYLAVSLENLHLIGKLRVNLQQMASQLPKEQEAQDIQWFRKLMFELQDKERMRIARDLHDTTMQDLFFLKRRLSGLLENNVWSEEDQEQMNSLIHFIELINTNLRESCFDLHPYLLKEIGLIHTVQKLLDKEAYHTPFTITLEVDPTAHAIEDKDLESKNHIFRIIQELINNAMKHSNASFVKLSMLTNQDKFSLLYEDDGVGFSHEVAATREIGGSGIGMEQMRGRILYLNGQLALDSTTGRGLKCHITIPLNLSQHEYEVDQLGGEVMI